MHDFAKRDRIPWLAAGLCLALLLVFTALDTQGG